MKLNQQIINSDICLFLGAGASAPFGKALMASFMDRILEKALSEESIGLLQFLCKAKGKDLEEVFEDLSLFINKSYYLKQKDAPYYINNYVSEFRAMRNRAIELNKAIRKEIIEHAIFLPN